MRRSTGLRLALTTALLLAACGEDSRGGEGLSGAPDPGTGGDAGEGDGGDGGDASGDGNGDGDGGDGGGDDGEVLYDVGVGEGETAGDNPGNEGCDKVDFLFVIDASSSMRDNQDNLVANFPTFIAGMQSLLPKVDSYHVGVITTDDYRANTPQCERFGGLVVQKFLNDTSNPVACGPYATGANYMSDADDLGATFGCPAQMVGGNGSERPMLSLMAAVDGTNLDGPGQCNEGFLRPDSLLIVIILTDEEDGKESGNPWKSPGTPASWFEAVVSDRGGIEGNIAVLSLITTPDEPCGEAEDPVYTGAEIEKFTEMFTHGFVGAICEPDYGPYFQQALDVVGSACDGFVPPG